MTKNRRRSFGDVQTDWSDKARAAGQRCRIAGSPDDLRGRNVVDISDVQFCVDKCGSHFFDKGTTRFFNSRVDSIAYADGEGGAYFATTEKGPDGKRRASVRHYSKCWINTVGEFQSYRTMDAARKAAKKLAG